MIIIITYSNYFILYLIVEIKMNTYSIVEFIDDNTIEAVPTVWVNAKKRKCAWPTTKNSSLIKKLIEFNSIPNSTDFKYYVAKVLKTSGKNINLYKILLNL